MTTDFEQERQRIEQEAQRERERLAQEAREAQERLAKEAREQQERIAKEAHETQERIRRQQSEAEQQAEAIKAQAREAERIEQRKRDLPFTKPRPLGTERIIADVERQRLEAHAEGEKARTGIETEKEKIVADIEKSKGEAVTDIERQKAEAETKVGEWEAENLARITKAEQKYQEQVRAFEAANIKLDTGEYIAREDYDKLNSEAQNYLKQYGLDKFNEWIKETQAKAEDETDKFKAEHIIIGDYAMPITDWNELDPKYQSIAIQQNSFDAMNKAIETDIAGWNTALEKFKPYLIDEVKEEYDILAVVRDVKAGKLSQSDAEALFGTKEFQNAVSASEITDISGIKRWWRAITPWEEEKGEKATIGQVGLLAADMIVPAVWTRHLMAGEKMPAWNIALNIGLDLLVLIPVAGWIGRAVAKSGVTAVTKATGLFGKEFARTLAKSRITIKAVKQTAIVSGKAHEELVLSIKLLKKTPLTSAKYPAVASKTQQVIQRSRVADMKFVEALSSLEQATPRQLAKLEKLSGLKGIKSSIMQISKAQAKLDKAWRLTELTPIDLKYVTPVQRKIYLDNLYNLQRAKTSLDKALTNFANKTKPRFPEGRTPQLVGYTVGWGKPKPIKETDDIIQSIEKYLAVDKSLKPKGVQPWELTPKKSVAIKEAEKATKVAEKGIHELKLKPEYKEAVETAEKLAKAPKVKPKTLPSVFPGIRTVTKADVGKEPLTITVTETGRMTPEQIRRLYGTDAVVEAIGQPLPDVNIIVTGKPHPITPMKIDEITKTTVAVITKAAIQEAIKAWGKGLPKGKIEELIRSMVDARVKALSKAQVRAQTKAATKVIVKTAMKVVPKTAIRIRPRPKLRLKLRLPIITLPIGKKRPMTEEELAGSIAWKQGFIYKLIYPPYGEDNIINTKEPIEGVKYYKGLKSAYKSIVRLGGKVPASIKRDMGIVDIYIRTPKVGKPVLAFKADIKQKTRLTPRTKQTKLARLKARQASMPSASGIFATR